MSLIKELIGKLTDCKDTIKQKFDIVKDKVGHTFEVVKDKVSQVFESCKSSAKCTVATGLIAAMMFASLASCANNIEIIDTDNVPSYGDTVIDSYYTDHITDTQLGYETESTDSNNSNNFGVDDFDRFEHSDAYNQAKQKWGYVWGNPYGAEATEEGFLKKAAFFNILEDYGCVYYNENGKPRALNAGENFDNVRCIQSMGWLDLSTSSYYQATQFISGPIDSYSDDTYVVTLITKNSCTDKEIRDLLLLSGDWRINVVIQELENSAEVLVASAVDIGFINAAGYFRDLPNGGVNQNTLDYYGKNVCNFIVPKPNEKKVEVYFTPENKPGQIYHYVHKYEENSAWDRMLKGNIVRPPISQEYRDSLTPNDIMLTYSTPTGPALYSISVEAWSLYPSDEQKNSAMLKYELLPLRVDITGKQPNVDNYLAGKIKYGQVNSLTRDYVENLKSGLVQ